MPQRQNWRLRILLEATERIPSRHQKHLLPGVRDTRWACETMVCWRNNEGWLVPWMHLLLGGGMP